MKHNWIAHNCPTLDQSDSLAVSKVIGSNWVAEGPTTEIFEQAVAKRLQQKYAKAVSSGSAALHLALLALNIKKGDEVIISTYACTALLNAIAYVGANATIADIDEKNLGISPQSVRKLITRKTKAIITHHTFGFPASILQIKSFGIPVIEDCAQALGSEIENRPCGSFGDLSICSFYATKMLTSGYGGMVLTSHSKWANMIRDLTHYDQRKDYRVRYNYCLSDINSALGLNQLKKLDNFLKTRKRIAEQYIRALKNTDLFFWQGGENESPNFYRFVVGGIKPYSTYLTQLSKEKIKSISPIEPYQLLHRYLRLNKKTFQVAETIAAHIFSLPIYPKLNNSEISRICRSLTQLI